MDRSRHLLNSNRSSQMQIAFIITLEFYQFIPVYQLGLFDMHRKRFAYRSIQF